MECGEQGCLEFRVMVIGLGLVLGLLSGKFGFGLGVKVGLGLELRLKIRKLSSCGRSLGAGFIRETGIKEKIGFFSQAAQSKKIKIQFCSSGCC